MGNKRGERENGTEKHCGIRIASKWKFCPMCGAKRVTRWVR